MVGKYGLLTIERCVLLDAAVTCTRRGQLRGGTRRVAAPPRQGRPGSLHGARLATRLHGAIVRVRRSVTATSGGRWRRRAPAGAGAGAAQGAGRRGARRGGRGVQGCPGVTPAARPHHHPPGARAATLAAVQFACEGCAAKPPGWGAAARGAHKGVGVWTAAAAARGRDLRVRRIRSSCGPLSGLGRRISVQHRSYERTRCEIGKIGNILPQRSAALRNGQQRA